jgi:hypothetical protein
MCRIALAISVASSMSYTGSSITYSELSPSEYHKRFSGHYPTNKRVGSHFNTRKKKVKRKKK